MTSRLDSLRVRAAAVEVARGELRDEIVIAHACGERVAEIARAAGLTRQRVYQIVAEAEVVEAGMQARLALIDGQYEALVDKLADGRPGDYKRVTALQNGAARKLARRGIVQRTVRQMMRDVAESELLAVLESRRDDPVVQVTLAKLDEAAVLRKRLSALAEARAFGEVLD